MDVLLHTFNRFIAAEDVVNGIDGVVGHGFVLITQFGGITLNVFGTRANGKTIDAQPLEFIYSDFDAVIVMSSDLVFFKVMSDL